MFADKFQILMKKLGFNNKTLASCAGLDPSSLSRLRSGSRVLPADSVTVVKLLHGLFVYADDTGKTDELCSLTGADPDSGESAIREAISSWLYEGHSTDSGSGKDHPVSARKRASRKQFGDRFNVVMEISGLSNIALSRKAHVDPSLISRYRAGVRSPISNPEMAKLISSTLFRQIESAGRLEKLSGLMNVRTDLIDESFFAEWLCTPEHQKDESITSAEKLLGAFESMLIPHEMTIPEDIDILSEPFDESKNTYEGYEGLREAVIRFLKTAAREHAPELLLYSNQSMDWMTGDPLFLRKWSLHMAACVKSGVRIRIIHNIDRNLDEMNRAIISWLPLYISGMIEPYYCTLSSGSLFSRTLFLYPGHACINASLVAGTEDHGTYAYETSAPALDELLIQFNGMINHSKPLAEITSSDKTLIPRGDMYIIQPMPSLLSMPENVAKDLDSEIIKERWSQIHDHFVSSFEYRVYECVTLQEKEDDPKDTGYIESIPGSRKITYTKDAYKDHLRNIISLMNSYPGYRLIELPEMPFLNMQLIISEDFVRIIRTDEPVISFTFTHPLMCHAFVNYAEKLTGHYKTDRKSTVARLKELIG